MISNWRFAGGIKGSITTPPVGGRLFGAAPPIAGDARDATELENGELQMAMKDISHAIFGKQKAIVLTPVSHAHSVVMSALHGAAFDQPWDESWSVGAFAHLLASPGVYGFLAEGVKDVGKGAPVGMILCRMAAQEAEVLTVAVLPAVRGRGVGAALLAASIEQAKKHDIVEVFLEVSEDNVAARRLYQGADFSVCGRRPKYYKHPDGARDAIVMRRALDTRD